MIHEELAVLLNEYDFNINTLSHYLGIEKDAVTRLSHGDIDVLPEDNQRRFSVLNKISFLYYIAVDEKDLKLEAFLQVLVSYHKISKKTIAKMAGVEVKEIEKILSSRKSKVSDEIKYKIAVTVMSLRFFLKENEA